ncbi:MAG TPA: hypothetical protein VMD91_14670 [Candidatus Sulfotelmatobacter sp.]|nr:hypothetical protein [Candidatus Sulfotelmatobacter sp.]
MTARTTALVVAAVAIALVVAQDLEPGYALYHSWQYALALALALALLIGYAHGVRRGADGVVGRRLLVALAGAAIVDVAGLASGLLGPDTADVSGAPGTVVPVPALGAAAFFGPADAAAIARGDGTIVLRRRGHGDVVLGTGTRRLFGESVLSLAPHPAVYVHASDARGAHLTITQPTGTAFLSPVLQFGTMQRINDALTVPVDTFATPALHRVFRALYFTPRQLANFPHHVGDPTKPGVILTAQDDRGTPMGITITQGEPVVLGGVTVQLTVGSYPALAIASAPDTWALALGSVLVVLGLVWTGLAARANDSDQHADRVDDQAARGGDRGRDREQTRAG